MYCFDTDVVSALVSRDPPLHLIQRLALVPPQQQTISAITLGEILFGVEKRGSRKLRDRVRDVVVGAFPVLPFDRRAAEAYAPLRADLEGAGKRLAEPDLRIAGICLARDLTLITANVRHFARVPGLRVENWLAN